MGAREEALFSQWSRYASQAAALAAEAKRASGRAPAILVVTSHPPTFGDTAWVRFHLFLHGLKIANYVLASIGSRREHPQCLLAIDPYALDSVPVWVAGLYAGFMRGIYIAYDRQASSQTPLQKILLRGTAYHEIGWSFLRRLRKGSPVLMMVGGGLPHNARLLHACREFVRNVWPRRRPGRLSFEHRFLQEIATPYEGRLLTETGVIPEARWAELRDWVKHHAGHAGPEEAWQTFREEFQRDVPWRRRLFRILEKRLVKKNIPVLLIGINDDARESSCVRLAGPWLWKEGTDGDTMSREVLGKTFKNR